ncbi:M23 family metallopeptidase [Kineosporia sp. A_224]|uniref:M23 family metallopeptidase n=1 Tax=Kineosporia sp. A_224 TaxID=1962180 RepID=UPI000B4B76D2|nr:M23 family metallopeptidase [Kineosporia sp. A_224]
MRTGTKVGLAALAAVVLLAAPLLLVVTVIAATVAAAVPQVCLPGGISAGGAVEEMLDGLSTNPRVRAQQWANAAAVVAQGRADGVPVRGLVIAVMTARQESSLINVAYGDIAGPDSRGLFQQRDPWGPLAVRMTPRGAAHLFFTGGRAPGTPGLLDLPGWTSMPLWQAANRVQRSAFPTAYARWQTLATTMVATLLEPATSPAPPNSPDAGLDAQPVVDPAGLVCTTGPVPGEAGAVVGAGGWVSPLAAGRYILSSPFGMRTLEGLRRLHAGQDLAVPVGTPVHAAAAGTVVFAGNASGYGYLVTIQHPDGVSTRYAHLSVIRARPGPVEAGVVIGLSGGARGAPGAGHSTGPHLHFEVRRGTTPIDPVPWMRAHGAWL